MPLFGEREEALREEFERRRPDRQLVRLGTEQPPVHTNEIAEVEQPEDGEVALRQGILPDVHLNLRAPVGDCQEVGFPEAANCEYAASRPREGLRGLELFPTRSAVGGHQLVDGMRPLVLPGVGIDPERDKLAEVVTPLAQQVGFSCVLVGHQFSLSG